MGKILWLWHIFNPPYRQTQ